MSKWSVKDQHFQKKFLCMKMYFRHHISNKEKYFFPFFGGKGGWTPVGNWRLKILHFLELCRKSILIFLRGKKNSNSSRESACCFCLIKSILYNYSIANHIVTCHSVGRYFCAVSRHKFSVKSHHALQSLSPKTTPEDWNRNIFSTTVHITLFYNHY